jgi:membrane protease YdiL (CAAX protease family)
LITGVIIIIAWTTFARRLKGFGLNPRTLLRDFAVAAVNLLTVWPVLLAMVVLTTLLGKLIYGSQFEMQQHAELQLITESSSVSLRVLVCVLAVAAAPVVEELLFRGLFQTVIRSYVVRPWPAILASSIVFAAAHENVEHWPALFVLGMCLGYAYERSGSLFRPIFIHTLFNGVTIAAALSR